VGIERFHCETGRTEEYAGILLKRAGKKGRTVAILDPPRQGCQPPVIDALQTQLPDLLIYVSCNPATLARDLKRLGVGEHYTLTRLGCFDMFPQTAHMEAVAVLTRIGPPPDRTWKPGN
jgi:23S rRNA (uracil1939-C5)-methyltransferase